MDCTIYYLFDKQDEKQTPVYVGQTNRTLHQRLLEHRGDTHRGSTTHLHYYMRNKGIQNFDIVEIIKCSKEEATIQETIAIELLNPKCNKQRVCTSKEMKTEVPADGSLQAG